MANKFIFEVDDMAEGVYMASGDVVVNTSCWEVWNEERQKVETGRNNYTWQIHSHHKADAGHNCNHEQIRIIFDTVITNAWCEQMSVTGFPSNTIYIDRWIIGNPNESVGFGGLYVVADTPPTITHIAMTDEINGLFK